jgi:phosphatidylglycerophosphatase A
MFARPFWLRLVPSAVVVNLATLWRVGDLKAPGTWGTVCGMVWFTAVLIHLDALILLLVGLLGAWLAVYICGEAEARLQKVDPGEIVLDEFVAIPFCFVGLQDLLATAQAWQVVLAAFLFFRLFDIAKPLGIARLQRYPDGLGVVADDVAAAVVTCACLHLGFRLGPLGWAWLAG